MVDYFTRRGLPPLRRNVGGPTYGYPVWDQPDLLAGTVRWPVSGIGGVVGLETLHPFTIDSKEGLAGPIVGGFGPGVDPGIRKDDQLFPTAMDSTWAFSQNPTKSAPLPQKLTQIAETEGTMPAPRQTPLRSPTAPIDPRYWRNQDTGQVIDIEGESGGDPSRGPAIPGSGYRYADNVLKGAWSGPFSEMRALSREGAPASAYFGPAMAAAVGSQIPGAGLLGLFSAGLNKLGAYHQFNPATDSNLFVDPETGRATWGTTDPGGSGSQRGTLNLYNMLQDYGGSYPTRQVQTPRGYANAGDLAHIMAQGDRPPEGLYSQQTPVGYQDFGGNVTNQEALNTYNLTGAGAILNEAAEILGPDAGYNETSALAEAMAENLQDQMDYSDQDWGDWI